MGSAFAEHRKGRDFSVQEKFYLICKRGRKKTSIMNKFLKCIVEEKQGMIKFLFFSFGSPLDRFQRKNDFPLLTIVGLACIVPKGVDANLLNMCNNHIDSFYKYIMYNSYTKMQSKGVIIVQFCKIYQLEKGLLYKVHMLKLSCLCFWSLAKN